MDHPQTPRVLASHLEQFRHRIVRVLGKVVQLKGESAVIDAGGHIDVQLNRVRWTLQPSSPLPRLPATYRRAPLASSHKLARG